MCKNRCIGRSMDLDEFLTDFVAEACDIVEMMCTIDTQNLIQNKSGVKKLILCSFHIICQVAVADSVGDESE